MPNTFGFDIDHIIRLSKLYFIFNFHWLYILVALVCFIYMIRKKTPIPGIVILCTVPVVFCFVLNCAYITYENPRYLDALPVLILIIDVVMLVNMEIDNKWTYVLISMLFLISFLSSFYSFDPVSDLLFHVSDVGERRLYSATSSDDWGGDESVYNRQYYGLDIVFDRALERAIDAEDDLIAVSTGNNTLNWNMNGGRYSYSEDEGRRYFDDFWDIKSKTRAAGYLYDYWADPTLKPVRIRYVYPGEDVKDALSEGRNFTYIYMPTQNDKREEIVRKEFNILEEGSFSSHGFVLSFIRGKTR